jgi:serine protease Do
LETGQSVFAIGDTLGRYQNTVTKGVVSGLGRSVDSADTGPGLHPRHEQLIQTDAAINPGNSGGPLINLNGEVVGMNTIIDTEGESLGFAIPINLIKSVVNQLQTFGKASRAYLGVGFVTLSQVTVLDSPNGLTEGAYVSTVAAGSPADVAGLKPGDVIIAVNSQALNEINELDNTLAAYQAGQQVNLTYARGSQTLQAQVILGQLP